MQCAMTLAQRCCAALSPCAMALLLCACVVMSSQAVFAQSLSTLVNICTEPGGDVEGRSAKLKALGFAPLKAEDALYSAGNAAQVAIFLYGRTLPYSQGAAKAQFTSLYKPGRTLRSAEGEASAILAKPNGQMTVKVFQTDKGLIGCSASIDRAMAWQGLDVPVRKAWDTEAGVSRSHSRKADPVRIDTAEFTSLWTQWFDVPGDPHFWLEISTRNSAPMG